MFRPENVARSDLVSVQDVTLLSSWIIAELPGKAFATGGWSSHRLTTGAYMITYYQTKLGHDYGRVPFVTISPLCSVRASDRRLSQLRGTCQINRIFVRRASCCQCCGTCLSDQRIFEGSDPFPRPPGICQTRDTQNWLGVWALVEPPTPTTKPTVHNRSPA